MVWIHSLLALITLHTCPAQLYSFIPGSHMHVYWIHAVSTCSCLYIYSIRASLCASLWHVCMSASDKCEFTIMLVTFGTNIRTLSILYTVIFLAAMTLSGSRLYIANIYCFIKNIYNSQGIYRFFIVYVYSPLDIIVCMGMIMVLGMIIILCMGRSTCIIQLYLLFLKQNI